MTRRIVAEALGTGLLLVAVVGSGIATTVPGNTGQLMEHGLVVGLALVALIMLLAPVSGAHFNPVVTLVEWRRGALPTADALAYVPAQVVGGVLGVVVTNLMFGLPAVTIATKVRVGPGTIGSEALATGVLVLVVLGLARTGSVPTVAAGVGGWIAAAIVATPSTSLANPAVTLARVLSDTWTGVSPGSVAGLVAGQLAGGLAAALLGAWLLEPAPAPEATTEPDDVAADRPPTPTGADR